METLEFNAQNIKCMGCVNAIQEGLAGLSGIDKVDVDIERGHVTVSGQSLSRDLISEKMTALGYPMA